MPLLYETSSFIQPEISFPLKAHSSRICALHFLNLIIFMKRYNPSILLAYRFLDGKDHAYIF
jgi:hypothetical protein